MNMRKLFAIALLVLALALPGYADESGQMDTPKAKSGQTVLTQDVVNDPTQTQNGQMDTTLTVMLGVVESILALI